MLEPPGYSVPACGRLKGCARGDVAEYADGYLERRAVQTVEHGMAERGCHLWRNGGCRFGHLQFLGPPRHGLCGPCGCCTRAAELTDLRSRPERGAVFGGA